MGKTVSVLPPKKPLPHLESEDPCILTWTQGQWNSVKWKENSPVMRTEELSFHLLQEI